MSEWNEFLLNDLLLFYRKKLGIKQHLLAKEMKISDSVLSEIENKNQILNLAMFQRGISYLKRFDQGWLENIKLEETIYSLTEELENIFDKIIESTASVKTTTLEEILSKYEFEKTHQIFEMYLAQSLISFINKRDYIRLLFNVIDYTNNLTVKERCLAYYLISRYYTDHLDEVNSIKYIEKMAEQDSFNQIPGLFGFVNFLKIRTYVMNGKPTLAIPYINKGRHDLLENNFFYRYLMSEINIANVFVLLKQYATAKIYLENALQSAIRCNYNRLLVPIHNNLAWIGLMMNNTEEAQIHSKDSINLQREQKMFFEDVWLIIPFVYFRRREFETCIVSCIEVESLLKSKDSKRSKNILLFIRTLKFLVKKNIKMFENYLGRSKRMSQKNPGLDLDELIFEMEYYYRLHVNYDAESFKTFIQNYDLIPRPAVNQ